MAERRMIHRKASVSTDLADLHAQHGGSALSFYLLMIPHLDRWGCVPDSPAKLRAMVVPMLDGIGVADVKTWTAWMVRRGMLEKVTGPAGDRGLRSPDFHEHQRGSEFQKESPSPFEPPEITAKWVRSQRKAKVADMQEGRRPVADQAPTGRSERKGREVTTSPSFPPSPIAGESAGAPPEPDPSGAQAPPPEAEVKDEPAVETNGHRLSAPDDELPVRLDRAAIVAALPEGSAIRAAIERGRSAA